MKRVWCASIKVLTHKAGEKVLLRVASPFSNEHSLNTAVFPSSDPRHLSIHVLFSLRFWGWAPSDTHLCCSLHQPLHLNYTYDITASNRSRHKWEIIIIKKLTVVLFNELFSVVKIFIIHSHHSLFLVLSIVSLINLLSQYKTKKHTRNVIICPGFQARKVIKKAHSQNKKKENSYHGRYCSSSK